MRFHPTLSQKALILVVVPSLFATIIVVAMGNLFAASQQAALKEQHAKEVIGQTEKLLKHFSDTGMALVIYLTTKNSHFSGQLDSQLQALPPDLQLLKKLTRDNANERQQADQVESLANEVLDLVAEGKESLATGGTSFAFTDPIDLEEQLRELTGQLVQKADSLSDTARRNGHANFRDKIWLQNLLQLALIGAVAFNGLLAFALSWYFHQGTIKSWKILLDNAQRLGRNQQLHELQTSGDPELAQLDEKFHEMADELAEAARKENAIVENAMDVIFSLDAQLRFTKVNAASAKVWNIEPQSLTGRDLSEIVEKTELERTINEVLAAKSQNTTTIDTQIKPKGAIKAKDSLWSVHWSQVDSAFFCVAHDITQRKELERMKEEFLAMVSHDLRAPLASIQVILELIEAGVYGDLSERGQSSVVVAMDSSAHMVRLLGDLLDIKKLEAGEMNMLVEEFATADLFERSVALVSAVASSRKITIEFQQTDLRMLGDLDRLVQVLVNLLSNAIKYSEPESSIEISACAHEDSIELSVADHGRGIPENKLAQVFERFKQVERSDATVKRGAGLGLAICKAIVEAHGGTIGVDSTIGTGSRFWFRLPNNTTIVPAVAALNAEH
jgi:PAS domain S-box-containing protein